MVIVEGNKELGANTNLQSGKTIPQWEYLIVRYNWGDDTVALYNHLGLLGWEKVTTSFNPSSSNSVAGPESRQVRAVFKRPL